MRQILRALQKGLNDTINIFIYVINYEGNDEKVDVYYFGYIEMDKNNQCEITKIRKMSPFDNFDDYYIGIKIKRDDIKMLSSTPNPKATRCLIPWSEEHILGG